MQNDTPLDGIDVLSMVDASLGDLGAAMEGLLNELDKYKAINDSFLTAASAYANLASRTDKGILSVTRSPQTSVVDYSAIGSAILKILEEVSELPLLQTGLKIANKLSCKDLRSYGLLACFAIIV